MSIKVMTQVWDHYPDGGSELLLALALADHAHDDGGSIYPAVSAMALKIRQSERNVQYLLGKMRKRGWLEKVQEGGIISGKHLATMYRIPVERLPQGVVGWVQTLHPTEGCKPAHGRVQPSAKTHTPVCTPIIIEPSCKPSAVRAFALPPWIPPEVWEGYTAMRRKIRKPMTDRARDLVIKKLLGMKQAGQNPAAILDQSVRNSWTDVYPVKQETAGEAAPQNGWWSSDQGMLAKAKELKISTEGLTSYQLKSKITEKLAQPRAH